MEMCSPTCLGFLLFGLIYMVCIEGLMRKRHFQGTDVGVLFDKHAYIITEIYASSVGLCALRCTLIDECQDFLFRDPDTQPDYDHCYTSPDHYGYSGHLNTTISGITCQRWDTHVPNLQIYDATLMVETTLTEAENYCRDANFHGATWCLTTDPGRVWEECNIVKCMTTGNNCRLYSNTSTPNGPWIGYSYYRGS